MWGAIKNTNLITSNNNTPVFLIHGEADATVSFNTASPFGYTSLPQADGSNPINTKLNTLNFTNKETYFVPNVGHEFYGVANGTWTNGTGGNTYWPIVLDRSTSFLWKQHKPTANYTFVSNTLTINFTDTSSGATSWSWDFGDGTSSTLQNPTHTYATSGNYSVALYIENSNKSWDEMNQSITLSTMGLAENSIELFQLYPNPTNAIVTISLSKAASKVSYQIIDYSGKIVLEQELSNSQLFNVNVENLASGLYFIKITMDETIAFSKIVKN